MEPRLRDATIDDAALLAGLGERTFRETFQAFNSPEDLEEFFQQTYREALQRRELEDSSNSYFIAESAGSPVGFAMLRPGPPEACVTGERPLELARIYVLQEWHGRGIAAALMRRCIEEAQRQGARTLWLGVWEQNHRAQAFYRKYGFEDVGWHLFHIGKDPQRDRILAKKLGG